MWQYVYYFVRFGRYSEITYKVQNTKVRLSFLDYKLVNFIFASFVDVTVNIYNLKKYKNNENKW